MTQVAESRAALAYVCRGLECGKVIGRPGGRPERKRRAMRGREARVRPQFAEWYPKIPPGVWHDAVWTREMVLAQLRGGSPKWMHDGRVLSDRHFEFQGGQGGQRRSADERRRILPPFTGTPGAAESGKPPGPGGSQAGG